MPAVDTKTFTRGTSSVKDGNFVSDSFVFSRSLFGSLTLVRRLPRNGGDSRRAVNGEKKRAHSGELLYSTRAAILNT